MATGSTTSGSQATSSTLKPFSVLKVTCSSRAESGPMGGKPGLSAPSGLQRHSGNRERRIRQMIRGFMPCPQEKICNLPSNICNLFSFLDQHHIDRLNGHADLVAHLDAQVIEGIEGHDGLHVSLAGNLDLDLAHDRAALDFQNFS